MSEIVICFISDDNYIMPTCVAITSMLMNKNHNSKYIINIIAVDITSENTLILNKLIEEKSNQYVEIKVIKRDNQYIEINNNVATYVTQAALFKFDIANILIEYDKILYLDSDIIILDDLQGLFNIDISDYYAAAVKDYIATDIMKQHQKINTDHYFNSGMMLLNLQLLRKDNLKEKLLYYKINGNNDFVDQDSFNFCFNNKVKFIDLKYNYMITNAVYDTNILSKFYDCDVNDDIVVLHITYHKPWHNNVEDKKYYYDFWHYYQYTNYFKENPIWAINKISEQKMKKIELEYNERISNIENYYNTKINDIVNYYNAKIDYIMGEFNKYEYRLSSIVNVIYHINNWIKLFGIYNDINYIYIYLFGMRFTIKATQTNINRIAWWLPIKKCRENFRAKFKIRPDQTRPDQTRPDQTRPDQTRIICKEYIYSYNNLKYKKLQPTLQYKIAV